MPANRSDSGDTAKCGAGGDPAGPFAATAVQLAQRGLAVIPCGNDDGKKPSVHWPSRRPGPNSPALSAWVEKFGAANVGVLTKLSGVTIVDVDAPELVEAMEARFGWTPLVTATPSGGVHLWYRANGERSRNLRRSEGLAVDVKAGGTSNGGFIVVPPSVRPSGPHAGKAYRFVRGGWDDLARLPTLAPGSLTDTKGPKMDPLPAVPLEPAPQAKEGSRNETLFALLRREVFQCGTQDDLLRAALEINAAFNPPMSDAEVSNTVRSVWGYRQRNTVFVPGGIARVAFTEADLAAFQGDGDALMMEAYLRLAHAARSEPFAVSDKAMVKADVIPGWSRRRYRQARDTLLSLGRLECVRVGGHGAKDPSRFLLREGSQTETQYNNTPLRLAPAPCSASPVPAAPADPVAEEAPLKPSKIGGDAVSAIPANRRVQDAAEHMEAICPPPTDPRNAQHESEASTTPQLDWVEAVTGDRRMCPSVSLVPSTVIEARRRLRWSGRKLASEADVPYGSIAPFEAGKCPLSPAHAAKVASVLGIVAA